MSLDPESVEEAVELFLERRRKGEAPDPAAFAGKYPAFAPDLSSALDALLALERTAGEDRDLLLSVPDRVGPYLVLRGIGRGGMGVVFEAVEEALGRRVALKVLPPELLASPSARARFRREAELAARLDHSGIATVYGAGVEGERLWIAMRFVDGETLARAIARSREDGATCLRLSPDASGRAAALRVAALVARIARALHAAHEQGVVHRDIKPSNVIVQPDGAPVLVDFGLAVEAESDGPTLTRTGEAPGTPAYLAPETVAGEIARPDTQSDVYALGVTLYECLALRRPFEAPTPSALYRAILDGTPPALRALNPSVPRDLAVVVATAMERDRTRRYRSADALAADLEACVAGRPIAARPVPLHGRILRWARREPRLALAIAAAIVIAIGGFAWVSMTNIHLAVAKAQAEANERVATRRADEVLSLSAIQDLKELEDRADKLWPADPEHLQAYEEWLADARVLVEGRPADPVKNSKKRPSLAEHKARLAEVRLRAKPLSAEQIEADERTNPHLAEWEWDRSKLAWLRRMLAEEPWPAESQESMPGDAKALNLAAWPLVDNEPTNIVYGGEVRGLQLARRALAIADDAQRAMIRDTLAWALFRCGQLDEALAEGRRAVDEAQGERKKTQLASSLERLGVQVALWKPDGGRSQRVEEAQALGARVAELASRAGERRTFEFEDGEDRWWHAQLAQLVSHLDAFADEKTGLDSSGMSAQHGWGIKKRTEFARTIVERSVGGVEPARRWAEAAAAIASSSKYGGLRIEPQIGLLPIGPDPDSGLWEFAHLQTGEPAERGAGQKLILREAMGLVFVLIPGGTFQMGAQAQDPIARNYDPNASGDEGPVHAVTLSPYFLSKYEMTQGQWKRFTGRNPSAYGAGTVAAGHLHTLLHPVEQVTWTECSQAMTRLSLALATEAQWEYGCRAGTDTPWWSGADRESLRGRVNIADRTARESDATWAALDDWPDLEDGWSVHAPIGSFPANPFGLHEVLGNVWEWCRDSFDKDFYREEPKSDPVATDPNALARVFRGGSFDEAASSARASERAPGPPEYQATAIGLRPARALAIRASR